MVIKKSDIPSLSGRDITDETFDSMQTFLDLVLYGAKHQKDYSIQDSQIQYKDGRLLSFKTYEAHDRMDEYTIGFDAGTPYDTVVGNILITLYEGLNVPNVELQLIHCRITAFTAFKRKNKSILLQYCQLRSVSDVDYILQIWDPSTHFVVENCLIGEYLQTNDDYIGSTEDHIQITGSLAFIQYIAKIDPPSDIPVSIEFNQDGWTRSMYEAAYQLVLARSSKFSFKMLIGSENFTHEQAGGMLDVAGVVNGETENGYITVNETVVFAGIDPNQRRFINVSESHHAIEDLNKAYRHQLHPPYPIHILYAANDYSGEYAMGGPEAILGYFRASIRTLTEIEICRIVATDQELVHLFDLIRQMIQLTKLAFFRSTRPEDPLYYQLIRTIPRLTQLQSLHINGPRRMDTLFPILLETVAKSTVTELWIGGGGIERYLTAICDFIQRNRRLCKFQLQEYADDEDRIELSEASKKQLGRAILGHPSLTEFKVGDHPWDARYEDILRKINRKINPMMALLGAQSITRLRPGVPFSQLPTDLTRRVSTTLGSYLTPEEQEVIRAIT